MTTEQDQIATAIMTKIAELAQYTVVGIANDIDASLFKDAYEEVKDEFDKQVELGVIPPKFRDVVSSIINCITEQFPVKEDEEICNCGQDCDCDCDTDCATECSDECENCECPASQD